MAMAIATIVGGLAVLWVVRSFRRAPTRPDPWDSEVSRDELQAMDTPVCVKCLTPVEDANQHYCPKCGSVTGEFTRYIPFVNIRFNYSSLDTLWRKVRAKETPLAGRVTAAILIIALLACGLGVLAGWLILY
ncbi:MAG: hypothetical protein A3K19_21300 [Lentisphaerae bacterium RIFOXYB12_FULL_65_16]|nr:MAG: hypothetical protein A3K19_21300 [Lentisphaerae bacterium RIFOXYB12_FULL_65_16]